MRKFLKIVHELSGAGLIGAYASCLILAWHTPATVGVEYVAARQAIMEITRWLLMPSLMFVLVSGLLAIAATPAYANAAWVWIKAALGLGVFEATLVSVGNAERRVSELATLMAGGKALALQLQDAVRAERNTLWMLMALALINVLLAVWRPRIRVAGARRDGNRG